MIVIMAFNSYNSYTNTSWLDRSDKHSEAELKAMGLPQLKMELKKAIDANDTDYFDQVNRILYTQQMNKANGVNNVRDANNLNARIKTKYEAIQKMPEATPDEQDAKRKAMEELFKNEMRDWTSKADSVVDFAKAQKSEAERLQALLDWAVSKKVKIKETLPFWKMGRLKRINHKVQKIKEKHPDAWAKPVLQYLMAIVETNHTGFSQARKRLWMKMFWAKNSQNIDEKLKTIQDKLRPDSKDWVVGTLVKENLAHLLDEAKAQYFEEQRRSIYGR